MSEVVEIKGIRMYMDGYLKKNLDLAKEVIQKDWDMVFAYDGYEGCGKSVKAMQDAFYCDNTLNLDRVVFTPYEFKKAILSAKKYQAVVYDEAYTGLSSRATMGLINRTLVSMLAEIRQRNLFVFVVMPTFFDLDKYVALWRSRALIHVYTGKNFQRGFFSFYNIDKKKDLYINGKKFYNYFKPVPNFRGRFTNTYVVDEKKYRIKKKGANIARAKRMEEADIKRQVEDQMFNRLMNLPPKTRDRIGVNLMAEILGISRQYFYIKSKKWEEMKEFE